MVFRFIIGLLSIPGIVIHEMAHVFFCRVFGVRIHKACYFRIGNPPGYVVHDCPDSSIQHIIIGTGPFIFNTLLGSMFALFYHLPSFHHSMTGYIALWLAISISSHAFPSTGDAKSIWHGVWAKGMPVIGKIISIPVVLFIYLGALGSYFCMNYIYGLAVALYMPGIIFSASKHIMETMS